MDSIDRSESEIREECRALEALLVSKNRRYGDSALNPVRVFSRADAVEQIKVRIDDKLSRLARGEGAETEDVELDLLGYLILLRIAKRRAGQPCPLQGLRDFAAREATGVSASAERPMWRPANPYMPEPNTAPDGEGGTEP